MRPEFPAGPMDERTSRAAKAQFGVPGLDDILNGGLAPESALSDGRSIRFGQNDAWIAIPVSGCKTGEKGLYITLSETEQELRETAASHNWSIPQNIDIFELVPPESLLDSPNPRPQAFFCAARLERGGL